MKYFRDLKGFQVGQLTVVEKDLHPIGGRNISLKWKCMCSCGNFKTISSENLTRKIHPTQSCGCLKKICGDHAKGKISYNSLPPGESNLNDLFSAYIKGAQRRDLKFNLTKAEFVEFIKQNCSYCGSPPLTLHRQKTSKFDYFYNGIDRVDNSIGYEKNNCVTCCKTCNIMKHALTREEFLDHIKRILQNIKAS